MGESLDRILALAGDLRSEIPGWEGSIGPSPAQYRIPHVYARSVYSGAGNCVCGRDPRHPIHVQIAPGVTLAEVLEEAMLELASVQVPQYTRASSRGNLVRVSGYSRMGIPGMQEHLTAGHGMTPHDFGQDFHHPQSLSDWHAFDHFARGAGGGGGAMSAASSLDHAHPRPLARASVATGHAAEHHGGGGAEHHGHGLGIGHMAAWEGPVIVHREARRTLDRQVRRGFYRHVESHGRRGVGKGPQGASKGAQGGSSSSGGGGGGSSSSGSSGSSGRGGSRGY